MRNKVFNFYSRPCGRGDAARRVKIYIPDLHFYSRPCGRGDPYIYGEQLLVDVFLLTPLREGRHNGTKIKINQMQFLLTPLREGRHRQHSNGA